MPFDNEYGLGWIEVYNRVNAPEGKQLTAEELAALAADYDPAYRRAPVLLGHWQGDDRPAVGQVKAAEVRGDSLFVNVPRIPAWLADEIENEGYTDTSIAWWWKEEKTGRPYLSHLALLSASNPAVPGLEQLRVLGGDPMRMSKPESEICVCADMKGAITAGQITRIETEKEGAKVMPEKSYTEIEHKAIVTAETASAVATATAELNKELASVKAELITAKAEADKHAATLVELAQKKRVADTAAAMDKLAMEGRILPAQKAEFAELMASMDESKATRFLAGLSALPVKVQYGEAAARTGAETALDDAEITAEYEASKTVYAALGITLEKFIKLKKSDGTFSFAERSDK